MHLLGSKQPESLYTQCNFKINQWFLPWLFQFIKNNYLCISFLGPVAEWLGRGLQNLVHQFKSGRDLKKSPSRSEGIFILKERQVCLSVTKK